MVVGYVRLSRDDNKRNYVSIQNQKLIINKYAEKNGLCVERWYEDDGISGYSFNRPAFKKMIEDLENGVDTIISKDLSRIGRHNAKVLLFIEDMNEMGKRLILIDDDYDTIENEDDIIGIKTWYNERYVKDTSKKVKRVMKTRQMEGTLIVNVPFGYKRNVLNKKLIEIEPETESYIRLIFDLYLNGYGFRAISNRLDEMCIPTPSMTEKKQTERAGKIYKRRLSTKWSAPMVREIINNDFYIGTLRLHKRERLNINGKDTKVSKEEHIVFENNHSAIIEKQAFELAQNVKLNRTNHSYRGQKKYINKFSGCLYCKDCGVKMTSVNRVATEGSKRKDKFYICSTYNRKGKSFCEYSHMVYEKDLIEAILFYLKEYSLNLENEIKTIDIDGYARNKISNKEHKKLLKQCLEDTKKELKSIILQKVEEKNSKEVDILEDIYNEIKNEKIEKIIVIEKQLNEICTDEIENGKVEPVLASCILAELIEKKEITRRDIETLVENIEVESNGEFTIRFKYGCSFK